MHVQLEWASCASAWELYRRVCSRGIGDRLRGGDGGGGAPGVGAGSSQGFMGSLAQYDVHEYFIFVVRNSSKQQLTAGAFSRCVCVVCACGRDGGGTSSEVRSEESSVVEAICSTCVV